MKRPPTKPSAEPPRQRGRARARRLALLAAALAGTTLLAILRPDRPKVRPAVTHPEPASAAPVASVASGAPSSRPEELLALKISGLAIDPAIARALGAAQATARATPGDAGAWGRLATVLMLHEFPAEAATAFAEAERLAPLDPRWPHLHGLLQLNRDADAAIALLRRAADRADARAPGASLPIAPGAETANRRGISRLRLAQLLAERGRMAEAEVEYARLLSSRDSVDGPWPTARLGLARIRHQQQRSAESVALLAPCLDDPHTRRAAQELLAVLHRSQGRIDEARAAAAWATTLPQDEPWPDPYWDEAATLRTGLKQALDQASALLDAGQPAAAIGMLEPVTRDYPADAETWYLLGWAWNQRQDAARAEAALRTHLARTPDSAKGHAQLAVALLGQRRWNEAVPVLERGLALKPTWRELHANLGFASIQLGRPADAERHYRHAVAADPNHVPSQLALAELLLRRGATNEARKIAQEAATLAPEDPRAKALLQRAAPMP